MNPVVRSVLLGMPQAAGIWLLLIVVALAVFTALMWRRRRGAEAMPDEGQRYADEVAVAAQRAAATEVRRRADLNQVGSAVEVAWRAFEEADRAWRRAEAAAVFAQPAARTPAEYAERERYLHRAATAACRRRELPIAELNEILAHRNGWDPTRHPAEQEAALRRAVRQLRLAAYRDATAAESHAWWAADLATASLRSLRDEAFTAQEQAEIRRRSAATD